MCEREAGRSTLTFLFKEMYLEMETIFVPRKCKDAVLTLRKGNEGSFSAD